VFDVVVTLFVLVAAIVWMRCRPSLLRTIAIVLCSVAGLLSKESAVVIPALLALMTMLTAASERRGLRELAGPWILTASTICAVLFLRALWRSTALVGHLDNLPGDRRQWKDMIVRPFAALAVPIRTEGGLSLEAYLVGLAVLVVSAALLLRIWAGHSGGSSAEAGQFAALTVGVGWVAISAAPLLLQFYVSPTLQGSRYLYLPAVGFSLVISASLAGRPRRVVVPAVGILILLFVYVGALRNERHIWRQAARTRDAVLAQAEASVKAVRCRTLEVLDPPDSFRGAFVFREGIAEALSGLPYDPDGASCVARWDGSALVSVTTGR
jgi:hypothetical protein